MATVDYTIKHWDWVVLWGKYWLPKGFGILIMVKWSMFVIGFEAWKFGGLLFIGPLAIGVGTISEDV